jgi:hypothetical protein
MAKPPKVADPQAIAAVEAARKDLVEAYRRYAQDARQSVPPAENFTREDLDREYERLERRWRLARKQLQRVFGQETPLVEGQLPGLHVELKLTAEQAARAYAILSALDRRQALDPAKKGEQLLEGGRYPLLNVGPFEAARVLDELDAARRQPPPYCYVVTAVYGPHSRELARAHARCGPVFRAGSPLLRCGWESYQTIGPRLASWADRSPRFARPLLELALARPILRAAGRPCLARQFARGYLSLLSLAAIVLNTLRVMILLVPRLCLGTKRLRGSASLFECTHHAPRDDSPRKA